MAVYVIDTIKPKNGLDFPVVEAVDVAVEGYLNLADAVTHFATDTAITTINTVLNSKANTSDVNTAVSNLQGQIDQIAQATGTGTADTEIAQARVDAYGITYTTLKDRLDVEQEQVNQLVYIETITTTVSGTKDVNYTIVNNGNYKFTNTGNSGVEVRLKKDGNVEKRQVISSNASATIKNDVDADTITIWFGGAGSVVFEDADKRMPAIEQEVSSINADISTINGKIDSINTELDSLWSEKTITKTVSGSEIFEYSISVGDKFEVNNTTDSSIEIRFRDNTSSTTNLQTETIAANTKKVITSTVIAGAVSCYFNSSGTVIFTDLNTRIGSADYLSQYAYDISQQLIATEVLSRPISGTREIEHTMTAGDYVEVENRCSSGVAVRLRTTGSAEDLKTLSVPALSTGYLKADVDSDIINVYFNGGGDVVLKFNELPNIKGIISDASKNENKLSELVLESGSIQPATGREIDSSTRLRTVNSIYGTVNITCPDGVRVARAYYFDGDVYKDYVQIDRQTAQISMHDGYCFRLTFSKTNPEADLLVEDLKSVLVLEEDNKRLLSLEQQPMVKFDFGFDLLDVSDIVEEKNYSRSAEAMFQIYSFFDELVDNEYVTKSDIASDLGLTYPEYASDYETFVYKFVDYNPSVNSPRMAKKKLLLIGGTHGDEQAAPFNLYLFAKQLCENYLTDENMFKLRSSFDIYIIPCLNGRGMINISRVNGNAVNINRNYPFRYWTVGGAGTLNYTGESPGSEFENQIIMNLIDEWHPDVMIDHHNYSYNIHAQFYTDLVWDNQLELAHQSLVDCSRVFKKKYPEYFGSGFGLVQEAGSGVAPGSTAEWFGSTTIYGREIGLALPATLEICDCITYRNGVHAGVPTDSFGSDTFSIADYTLKNQIYRYCQWVLDNVKE